MKKIYNLMLLVAAVLFASCSDIPSPYELFDQGGTSSSAEPEGTGIYADPFNCVAANAYIENGGDETAEMYVKGIVYSIDIDTSYGNATYYISDDGTSKNKLEIYRGYSKNGDKFKSDDEVKPGDEVIVCGKLVNYNGTFEMTQGSKIVYLNGEIFGKPTIQGDPKGNGTLDDPYNPVAANNFTNSLDDNATSENDVYIKGVISKVKECSAQFGNATFYITETGSTEESDFYVYRCNGLGNKPVDSDTYVKVGDEVIICGKVTKYVSQYGATAETVQKQAYIYSLNGKSEGGNTTPDVTPGTPEGNGTLDTPFNVAAAVKKCQEVGETATADFYYVKGIAETITTTGVETYGNITIDLVDVAGSSEKFKAFQVFSFNGEKFTAATAAGIKKGNEIVVKGKLVNFKGNTPETTGKGEGCVVFVNGKTTIEPGSGGNDNPGGGTGGNAGGVEQEGTTVKLVNADANPGSDRISCILNTYGWTNASDPTEVVLSDGTKITFAKGESTNAPKYYDATNGVRMYAKNILTINGKKKIAYVVLECDSYQGTNYVGNPTMTVSFSGNDCVMINDHTENKGGVQCRIKEIHIVYAE